MNTFMNIYYMYIIKCFLFLNLSLVSLISKPPITESKRVKESFSLPNITNVFVWFSQNCNQCGQVLGSSTSSSLDIVFQKCIQSSCSFLTVKY